MPNITYPVAASDPTNLLTDKRQSLSHKSLETMLLIKINDYAWNDTEKEEIIKAASGKSW